MSTKNNKIHLFVNNDKYYFIDIKTKKVIREFVFTDFLIDLYEDNYKLTEEKTFLFDSDNTSYILKLLPNENSFNNLKDNIETLKSFINLLYNTSEETYKIWGNMLAKITTIEYSIISDIKLENDLLMPVEVYSFTSYQDFILFTIFKTMSSNIKFNKCKNCGKYFVPTTKSNEIYCTRIYKNNRTCRDIGYENSVKYDELAKKYRNAYKTQNAKKQRYKAIKNIDEQFSKWAANAKEMYKLCKEKKIDFEEFSAWLKENQDWINK